MSNVGSIQETVFITPAAALINSAVSEATSNSIDSSTRVMVANGDSVKKRIFITDSSGNLLSSFTLPRFNVITFIKEKTSKVYGLNFPQGATAGQTATNLTFQKVHTNHGH